jgi:hypothetical protein
MIECFATKTGSGQRRKDIVSGHWLQSKAYSVDIMQWWLFYRENEFHHPFIHLSTSRTESSQENEVDFSLRQNSKIHISLRMSYNQSLHPPHFSLTKNSIHLVPIPEYRSLLWGGRTTPSVPREPYNMQFSPSSHLRHPFRPKQPDNYLSYTSCHLSNIGEERRDNSIRFM